MELWSIPGDNLTGDGDGDDEQIKVDLSKIDINASEICIVVTIHNAENRKQNFQHGSLLLVFLIQIPTQKS